MHHCFWVEMILMFVFDNSFIGQNFEREQFAS